jgi:hypothetical protein
VGVLAGVAPARAQVTPQNAGKLTLEALTARPAPPAPRRFVPAYHVPVYHAAAGHAGRGHATHRAETPYRAVAQHPATRDRRHRS